MALNDRVQAVRGKGRTFGGHPDIAVTDGTRVAYLECKMKDEIRPSQIEWLDAAFRTGILNANQVAVIVGVTAY